MHVMLIITFEIKKEKLQSFMKIIQNVKQQLPQVDGCQDVNIMKIHDNPNTITFIETWESIEKHQNHIKKVVDSGDWEYIYSHLLKEPKSAYYSKII